ncbi:gamma-type small acid-soluble spore protein [Halobacillus shinanisalinarum]|uniref:Small, acid-soluble spore protein gamma-type n=1 Tax=Halobacillus shinanisalinarum TaxID=2932258 RepID=A0ABY4GWS2_9BACI|nr:gamma-type small acid-soluble spore protein [Halobacillus shinanisalinarum]UOQ92621.1 gamma-type small acid-soluble spore protein [Halobacillus shinanisalinarum]
MAKQPKQAGKQAAGTDAQHVKQQNQQAAQGQGQFGTEFGAEQTEAQKVRKQNQQSQAKKK